MNHKEILTSSFNNLLVELLKFLENEKSYNRSTLNNYHRRLYKIPLYMQTHGIDSYTPDVGIEYHKAYLAEHDIGIPQQKAILTSIRRLNAFCSDEEYVVQHKYSIELLPEEYEHALNLFEANCHDHGNQDITIKKKSCFLRLFLKDCIAFGCTSIMKLNPSYVTKACLRVKNKDSWAVFREFLTLMNVMGITKDDLSALVPLHKQSFKVPVTYSEDEFSKIEKTIDRSTDIGKRDYAILLLASRLGMRSCDIVNLSFDNLDFNNNKLFFSQQKTGEALKLPLLPEIKEALENYINNGRPQTSERKVFIR